MGNMEANRTGIEARSSLRLCERFRDPLRTTYRKLKLEHLEIRKGLALLCTVKATNDTLVPEGIVLSALVFGAFP